LLLPKRVRDSLTKEARLMKSGKSGVTTIIIKVGRRLSYLTRMTNIQNNSGISIRRIDK
jgi:hypothetical protein